MRVHYCVDSGTAWFTAKGVTLIPVAIVPGRQRRESQPTATRVNGLPGETKENP